MRIALFCLALTLTCPAAWAQRFQAPSGPLGAGLSASATQTGRVYAETSLRWTGRSPRQVAAFPLVFGGGYKPVAPLELVVQLPIGIAFLPRGANLDAPDQNAPRGGGVAVGNLQLGAHLVLGGDTVRFTGGANIAFGPWTTTDPTRTAYGVLNASRITRLEDEALWRNETVALTTPARLEINPIEHLLLSGDGSFNFYFPQNQGQTDVTLSLAPGVAYVSRYLDVGGRFPLLLALGGSDLAPGDRAQVAFEPYARANLGKAFFNARWTMYLDDPLGFAFDRGGVWALHLGGGAGF